MRRRILGVVLCLFWSLVEVQSQTEYPYISFMGNALLNHAYVDLSLVKSFGSINDTVQCHTDLSTCCRRQTNNNMTIPGRGNWFAPGNSTRLPFTGEGGDIFESRAPQAVHLHRRNDANGPSGIYRCVIPTIAVEDVNYITVGEIVYVGLYGSGEEDITVTGGVTFSVDSDLNGASPQFTLTCISSGGPATTVTWTRDSVTVTERTETVLDNRITSQYTHTLTVTRRLAGLYTCIVANNKPSNASAQFTVKVASAPTNLIAVQEGATSIRVSWSPPTPLGDTTGYRIYYSGGSSGSVSISSGSTDNYLLTGLQNGEIYTISIEATSEHFHSEIVALKNITLAPALTSAPEMFGAEVGQRQVTFSWSPPPVTQHNGFITSYTLSCTPSPSSLPPSPSQAGPRTVAGFSPDTSYSCSVAATNSQGSGPPAYTNFTTQQDYMFFQLHLSGLLSMCPDVVSSERLEILEDVTSVLMDQLTKTCSHCGITSDIIDHQSFKCFTESPTYVTYRARLEGTSETASGSLISLIEDWVRGGASIIVTGVLMTVDSECSVAISSPSETQCDITRSSTTSQGSSNNMAIIGEGTAAVIIVLGIVIAVTAVIIVALVLKHRHRGQSIKNVEHEMTALPGSPDVEGVATKATFYEPGRLEDDYVLISSHPVRPTVTYEVPSLPPSCQTLTAVLPPVVTPTSWNADGAGEETVYENIPGDK